MLPPSLSKGVILFHNTSAVSVLARFSSGSLLESTTGASLGRSFLSSLSLLLSSESEFIGAIIAEVAVIISISGTIGKVVILAQSCSDVVDGTIV